MRTGADDAGAMGNEDLGAMSYTRKTWAEGKNSLGYKGTMQLVELCLFKSVRLWLKLCNTCV